MNAALSEVILCLFEDSRLRDSFTQAATVEDLFVLVSAFAASRGLTVSVEELRGIALANRRSWLERWLH